jgi:hypothetical protein
MKKNDRESYEVTECGFRWGLANVHRSVSHEWKAGEGDTLYISIETPMCFLDVCITPTGLIRTHLESRSKK